MIEVRQFQERMDRTNPLLQLKFRSLFKLNSNFNHIWEFKFRSLFKFKFESQLCSSSSNVSLHSNDCGPTRHVFSQFRYWRGVTKTRLLELQQASDPRPFVYPLSKQYISQNNISQYLVRFHTSRKIYNVLYRGLRYLGPDYTIYVCDKNSI